MSLDVVCTSDGSSRHSAPPVRSTSYSERARCVHVHMPASLAAARLEVPVFRTHGNKAMSVFYIHLEPELPPWLACELSENTLDVWSCWSIVLVPDSDAAVDWYTVRAVKKESHHEVSPDYLAPLFHCAPRDATNQLAAILPSGFSFSQLHSLSFAH